MGTRDETLWAARREGRESQRETERKRDLSSTQMMALAQLSHLSTFMIEDIGLSWQLGWQVSSRRCSRHLQIALRGSGIEQLCMPQRSHAIAPATKGRRTCA